MPRRKNVDSNALIEMVKENAPQNKIMEKFGLKTSTQLKVAYANALMESGQVPAIKTGRGKDSVSNRVSVNSRGSLIIPKKVIEHFGINIGTTYELHKGLGSGASLRLNRCATSTKEKSE